MTSDAKENQMLIPNQCNGVMAAVHVLVRMRWLTPYTLLRHL
jgi:hypothetical protein